MRVAGNDYDVREVAGAFGDLGTLIPFLVGYVTITRLDPQNLLLAFGLTAVVSGFYFRTPMPVQPMKAIGTAAIAHGALVTPGAVWIAAAATGVAWLALSASGLVTWVAALTRRPVVRGIVLGLGLSFILEGVTLMKGGVVLAIGGTVLTFMLLGQSRVPALLALLSYGAGAAILLDPVLTEDLRALAPSFRLPSLGPPVVTWPDVIQGTFLLALPQLGLTLGNAVIATADEHNTLFPERPVSVRQLAFDHGLMNVAAAVLGAAPMCRGAGGMAGHVRFGARTGGAVVILGAVLLVTALFFADSIATLFRLFPMPVLGVILFFAGMELATTSASGESTRNDRTVLVVTAGIALWNMGAAYLAGLILFHALRRGLVRL
jgi:hypothetical protein